VEGSFYPLTVKQRLVAHYWLPVHPGGFHPHPAHPMSDQPARSANRSSVNVEDSANSATRSPPLPAPAHTPQPCPCGHRSRRSARPRRVRDARGRIGSRRSRPSCGLGGRGSSREFLFFFHRRWTGCIRTNAGSSPPEVVKSLRCVVMGIVGVRDRWVGVRWSNFRRDAGVVRGAGA
jgi:hypothetical protein